MRRKEEENRKQKKESANDTSAYAVSPVEVLSSAVLPAKTYLTEKEIVWKKSEKKKRGQQKKTEDAPVVPPSRFVFVVSVSRVSSRPAYYCTLRKTGNQKEEDE